jgi:protein-tyrosine phosphatase
MRLVFQQLRKRGIDIRGHASRRLSAEVVRDSDFIYAMCRMHGEHILGLSRDAASKCALLTGDRDIPDPIGQPQEVYNSCADLIEEAVKKRISELVV